MCRSLHIRSLRASADEISELGHAPWASYLVSARTVVQKECQSDAEWEYLSGFRRADTQPAPAQDDVYRALRRRLLIDEAGPAWRLRVPLMQRWLRKRG